jgi:hypothetical protein
VTEFRACRDLGIFMLINMGLFSSQPIHIRQP